MRTLATSLFLLLAVTAIGQPVADGTVGAGEYTYTSGDWSMGWDTEAVYVAKTNVTPGNSVAVFFDTDPQSTPTAGATLSERLDPHAMVRRPFESDGGVIQLSTTETVIEIRIPWTDLGVDARPEAFSWLGYEHNGSTGVVSTMPAANAANGAVFPYFFAATTDPATDPFTNRQSTWDVTRKNWAEPSAEDEGARALREAITDANADTQSSRRYIVFELEDPTFAITTALPTITRTTTIDATTQPGYAGTPVVSLAGPGAGSGVDGISILGIPSSGCEIRGLNLGGFARAIVIYESNDTKIYGNYIGTNLAGTAAVPNGIGIHNSLTFDSIIGAAGLGNLVSGNSGDGIAVDSASRTRIHSNLIGVAADGTTPLPNGGDGIQSEGNLYTYVGDPSTPNVIANNGAAINAFSQPNILIRGNSIYANPIVITNPQPTPTIHNASAGDGTSLVIDLSAPSNNTVWQTEAYRFDLYRYDDGPKTWLAASPCFDTPNAVNLTWHVGTGYSTSDSYVLTATTYRDSCMTVADGTSLPTAPFSPSSGTPTTISVQVSDTTPARGSYVTFTATTGGARWQRTGTVSFSVDGQEVCSVAHPDTGANEVTCQWLVEGDGEREVTARYSGDAYNQPSEASTTIDVFTKTFTGTGDFYAGERWTGGMPPMPGEHFIIDGDATFSKNGPAWQYGSMTLGAGAVVRWTQNHTNALRVTSIAATGPATIDMTPGGYLETGTFDGANVTLVRGFGTVSINSGPIPGLQYYNLNVGSGTSAGPTSVFNDFHAGSFTATHPVALYRVIAGTNLQFATLLIPAGAEASAANSFTATTIDVAGSLNAGPDVVITGALTGTGTVKVMSTATPNSFGSQYVGAKTLTNLTVEFIGAGRQSVDALVYGNLTIDNGLSYGATLAGQTDVFGTLNLTLGNLYVGDGGPAQLVAHGNVFQTNLSWVVGTSGIARYVAAGTTSVLFPVGVEAGVAPITILFHDLVAPGFVTMAAHTAASFGGSISSAGIDPDRDANVYWLMTHALTANRYNVSATFTGLEDIASYPYRYVVRAKKGTGPWYDLPAVTFGNGFAAGPLSDSAQSYWFLAGNHLASAALSQITVSDGEVVAGTPVTVTVRVRDTANFAAVHGGDTVTLSTDHGTLGAVTDNGNGTYSAVLTANTAGTATITGTLNGAAITDDAVVAVRASVPGSGVKGDFNGDADSDLVWQNKSTGQTIVWLLDGTIKTGEAELPTVGSPSWSISGVDDFNDDGRSDLVWRHSGTFQTVVWLMNGTTYLGEATLPGVSAATWRIAGVGDFNHDGSPDLVWQNSTTFRTVVWLLNGTTYVGEAVLPNVSSSNWSIRGVGDFNNDGSADLVWRNLATLETVVWLMNGTTYAGQATLPSVSSPAWGIDAIGDYNGDGKSDVVWRNSSTFQTVVWFMNGTKYLGEGALPSTYGSQWTMVGPK